MPRGRSSTCERKDNCPAINNYKYFSSVTSDTQCRQFPPEDSNWRSNRPQTGAVIGVQLVAAGMSRPQIAGTDGPGLSRTRARVPQYGDMSKYYGQCPRRSPEARGRHIDGLTATAHC